MFVRTLSRVLLIIFGVPIVRQIFQVSLEHHTLYCIITSITERNQFRANIPFNRVLDIL